MNIYFEDQQTFCQQIISNLMNLSGEEEKIIQKWPVGIFFQDRELEVRTILNSATIKAALSSNLRCCYALDATTRSLLEEWNKFVEEEKLIIDCTSRIISCSFLFGGRSRIYFQFSANPHNYWWWIETDFPLPFGEVLDDQGISKKMGKWSYILGPRQTGGDEKYTSYPSFISHKPKKVVIFFLKWLLLTAAEFQVHSSKVGGEKFSQIPNNLTTLGKRVDKMEKVGNILCSFFPTELANIIVSYSHGLGKPPSAKIFLKLKSAALNNSH